MKKNLFSEMLFALLLVFFTQPLFSQQNTKLVFQNPAGYFSSAGTAITQTADGGFILTGTADATDWNSIGAVVQPRLIKLDADLNVEWDKLYLTPPAGRGVWAEPFGGAVEMPNGDFVLGLRNDSTNVEFIRVDGAGNLLHAKTLSPNYAQKIKILGAMPNGNALAARFLYSGKFEIVQLDAAGNMVSQKMVTAFGAGSNTIALPNLDVLVESYNVANQKDSLYRLDNQGNMLWKMRVINFFQPLGFADGTVGFSSYTPNFINFTRLDANGAPLSISPTNPPNGNILSTVAAGNGEVVVSGSTLAARGFLRKIDATLGATIWETESPNDGQPHLKNLFGTPTSDGWGAGVGSAVGNLFGFLRVGANSGISVNTLTGKIAKDDNQNCQVDAGEVKIGITKITASNGTETFQTFADQQGNYTLYLPAGTFNLTVETSQLFFEICPTATTSATFPSGASGSLTLDFPIQAQQTIHSISGVATLDQNDNCLAEVGEPLLENWNLRLSQGNQFVNLKTNAAGEYQVFLPDGSFSLEFFPKNDNFEVCGTAVRQVNLASGTPQNVVENFVVDPLVNCALMQTSISNNTIRPCSTRVLQVLYRNDGTLVADDATLDVTLDPTLTFVSSIPVANSVSGNVVHFELGDVQPDFSSNWTAVEITVSADCSLQIGQQVCITSEVTPDQPCTIAPNWQGAIIAVDGVCQNDSAIFTIKNIGNGPQVGQLDFVIVEDQIVLKSGNFNLLPGETQIEGVLGTLDSTTISGIADQEPGAPAADPVVFNLTNCQGMEGGTPSGTGNTGGIFSAQTCMNIVNSYDPNDKSASPLGYGDNHIVRPGTPIDYKIRFQNTGNDTAFTVILRDTLDANFDFSKIELLGSSHRFEFSQVENSVLHFRFDDILLPDSATNAAGSQGFVQFRIFPKANLPLGTAVENSAAIYFDQNPPILTNTVSRIYDEYFIVSNDEPTRPEMLKIEVAPNPFVTETTFKLPENTPAGNYILEIFDATGRALRSVSFSENRCRLSRADLPGGLIFWKISSLGKMIATGKIVAGE